MKSVWKVVFIGGAEYSENCRTMLGSLMPAHGIQFYNFTTRRDRVLDIFGERNYEDAKGDDRLVIGLRGLGASNESWIDLELDSENGTDSRFLKWLARERKEHKNVKGVHTYGVLNHWHCFTSEANLKLYAAIFHDPEKDWSVEAIREGIANLN